MAKWIKCSDRMPKNEGCGYECCIVRIKISENNYGNSYDWFINGQWEGNHLRDVTHWMYLKDIPAPETDIDEGIKHDRRTMTKDKITRLRESMNGKRFCSDINNPDTFVRVVNVHSASNGFQVSFNYGELYDVFTAYKKFIKRYPYQLAD